MSKHEIASQLADVSIKAAPPITVSGLTLYGYTLPDVVSVLTIVYLLIHIGYIVSKWIRGR